MPTLRIALLPTHLDPRDLEGAAAVVIDQLRATTTLTHALANGAARIYPCLEPDDARAIQRSLQPGSCLTGGERHGVRIEGFDLDNSPAAYSPERVAGKSIAFTTTNGTRALHAVAAADAVVLACLANLDAVARALTAMHRNVIIVCAGTLGRVTQEDALVAGLLGAALLDAGFATATADPRADDDTAPIIIAWARSLTPSTIADTVRTSRGGRNLARIGLHSDVDLCTQVNALRLVPIFDAKTRTIVESC